jgi:hypothetical protein
VRRANGLAAQLPVPIVRIVAQRFVDAVERGASEQFAERLHCLGKKSWAVQQIANNAKIAKESKLKFRLCNAFL